MPGTGLVRSSILVLERVVVPLHADTMTTMHVPLIIS
jgi:hypothetical protein